MHTGIIMCGWFVGAYKYCKRYYFMESLNLQAEEFFKNNIPESRNKKTYIKHVELVRKYAIELGKAYSADLVVLETAALLHDIGADVGSVHAQKSAEIAEKFLTENPIDTDTKNGILSAIRNHSMSQPGEEYKKNISLEDRILRDSDGIAFLLDTFKSFFDNAIVKYPKEKAIETTLKKINAMRAKITTEKGREIAEKFYPKALEYVSDS